MTSEYDLISAGIRFIGDRCNDDDVKLVAYLLNKIIRSLHMWAHGQEDDRAMFINQDRKTIDELREFLRERNA